MTTYRQRKQRRSRESQYRSFAMQASDAGWTAVASTTNEGDMVTAMVSWSRQIMRATKRAWGAI